LDHTHSHVAKSPCPLCQRLEATVASQRSRTGDPLTTLSCNHCGLFRNDPLPTSEELRRFHEVEYRESYKGIRTPKPRNVYRSARLAMYRLQRLARRLPPASKVLDVGSGSGEWLAVLQRAGHRVCGVEPDPFYGEFARQRYGVQVETKGILDLARPENSFEVITLFHVLEHLPDPLAALQHFREWLPPGGLLVIEVPNTNSIHQNPAGRFHPAHVIGFTKESLQFAGAATGWEQLEISLDEYDRNLLAVFRKPLADAPLPQFPDSPTKPEALLTTPATVARYYFQLSTYTRFFARMVQFAREWLALRLPGQPLPALNQPNRP
jgi:SAM-dependent methyltransferase